MNNISILILTYNEELHISRCIESLKDVTNQIFIVDSFSTDKTVEIAESLGATVFQRKWKNYADQFQWGLDNCPIETEWVMRLDADEYLDEKMQENLNHELNSAPESITGLVCNLRNVFLGKTIRFGGYDPLKLLRVWRFKLGKIESRWMDEHITLEHGNTVLMQGQLLHNNLNTHHWWTEKHNNYANREMVDILVKKYELLEIDVGVQKTDNFSAKAKRVIKERIYNNLPLFLRPTLYFFYRYVLFLGFLDGKAGFAYHFFQAYWYRSLVDVRVYEVEQLITKTDKTKESILNVIQTFSGHKID
ncbi:glycosyltransferase family 2 protein [Pseudoalteromonas marina]|nr:glycosyltransferase family 2 protein [Pseudoalteromonas marina]